MYLARDGSSRSSGRVQSLGLLIQVELQLMLDTYVTKEELMAYTLCCK
jgi:hypothetical protein